MQQQIQIRLKQLRQELETGHTELQKIERQQTYLRETMLRISGAIQVLEELLAEEQPLRSNAAVSTEPQLSAEQASSNHI